MSALSVLCSVLLACLGVSAVAVILSSSVGASLPTTFFHRLFPFLFPVSLFLLFECAVVALIMLFMVGYPLFRYESSVKFALSVG